MEPATQEAREAFAKVLESAAQKIRSAEGVPVKCSFTVTMPAETDIDNQRFRKTGEYTFKGEMKMQFPAGDWIKYGGEADSDG